MEEQALQWILKEKQVKVLSKNYRWRGGEIDLIFEEQNKDGITGDLVFVEVRARSRLDGIPIPEALSQKKLQCLKKTVDHYLFHYLGPATTIRFDLLYWNGEFWTYLPNLII